jgi:hypothetical protein
VQFIEVGENEASKSRPAKSKKAPQIGARTSDEYEPNTGKTIGELLDSGLHAYPTRHQLSVEHCPRHRSLCRKPEHPLPRPRTDERVIHPKRLRNGTSDLRIIGQDRNQRHDLRKRYS